MATRTTVFATNDNVTANDLNSLAGAWNSYVPTLTGFTPGNGTATGAYLQYGKLIIFRARFVFGSTSAGASAIPILTVPVTSSSGLGDGNFGIEGMYYDSSAGYYYNTVAYWVTTGTVGVGISGTNGILTIPTATTPFGAAWATGDCIYVSGMYEAA